MNTNNFRGNPLSHNLHKAVYLVDKAVSGILHQHFDMTFSQLRILWAIQHKPGLSQSGIADFHGLTRAAVTRQIELLKAKRLVEVRQNAKNRREHQLRLTGTGKAHLGKIMARITAEHEKIFSVLTSSERQTLQVCLEKLVTVLHKPETTC